MELIQHVPQMSAYLAADEVIDHQHPQVREVVNRLATEHDDAYSYAKGAFEFVRDTIAHSLDAGDPRVTWRASDVLEQRTGLCYAKAHALVALLRARSIPAALCYQRFEVVHGLVAVRLPGARGGYDRTRAATSRVSTRNSRRTVSTWRSPCGPRPVRRTTRSSTRHRIRRSWPP